MPTTLTLLLTTLAALAGALHVRAEYRGPRRQVYLLKPLTVVFIIAVAATIPGPPSAHYRAAILAGLLCSIAGDVFLMLPGDRFLPGVASFLLAHLAYLVAFLQVPGSLPWLVVGLAGAGLVAGLIGRRLVPAAARAGFGAPVAVYMLAICAMAVAATRTGVPAAIAGAWLFVASDSMLAWARFMPPGTPPSTAHRTARVAVMPTYHIGQVLLVAALLLG